MDGYIGEVRLFGGNFEPYNWAYCNGQLLSIAQYTALYSLIGTTYGGDGQTNFALPDMRGRVAIGPFQGAGLSPYTIGQMGGTESFTLTAANIANHSHAVSGSAGIVVSSQDGHVLSPVNNFPAVNGDMIYASTTDNSTMAPPSVALTSAPQVGSGNQPVNNRKPYLAINFIICLDGIYPARN